MSDELMPCPFCGSEKHMKPECDLDNCYHYVGCDSCDCEGPYSESEQEAIKKWNTINGVEYKHIPEPEGEENSGTVITK